MEDAGVAVERGVLDPRLMLGQPLFEVGRSDFSDLNRQTVRSGFFQCIENGPVGVLGLIRLALARRLEFPNQFGQRSAVGHGIHLFRGS